MFLDSADFRFLLVLQCTLQIVRPKLQPNPVLSASRHLLSSLAQLYSLIQIMPKRLNILVGRGQVYESNLTIVEVMSGYLSCRLISKGICQLPVSPMVESMVQFSFSAKLQTVDC